MPSIVFEMPPSTFAEMDGSPLPHLLFALSAAHPLLAPLPAHLSALLPSPRRAFHRVAGARVASFRISSFPCRPEKSARSRRLIAPSFGVHEVGYPTSPARWSGRSVQGRSRPSNVDY